MKKALVFGPRGQIGSYLVELLATKEYHVIADHTNFLDLDFVGYLKELLREAQPDEIYNMAGRQFAPASWSNPTDYLHVNAIAVMQMLQMISLHRPEAKFFNAGSAEMFDKRTLRQNEDTPIKPENPYGVSKQAAFEAVKIYRKQGLFACTGIFFNMESPRRKKWFFAEKVASEVATLKRELDANLIPNEIRFDKLDAIRDWGWAPEYAEAAWMMLQATNATDCVIGTGESHSCLEFVLEALKVIGLEDSVTAFEKYVRCDERTGPMSIMRADPSKIERIVGWRATTKFADVVRKLVEAELGQSVTVRQP